MGQFVLEILKPTLCTNVIQHEGTHILEKDWGLVSKSIVLFNVVVRELDVPGDIYEKKTYPFEFSSVEMPYESYNGTNVRLRFVYFLSFFIFFSFANSIRQQLVNLFTSWQVYLTGDNKSQLR